MTNTQNLITCEHHNCKNSFFQVSTRSFPGLCIEHACEADRKANGWTPENSAD